jgi:hypothetical protein
LPRAGNIVLQEISLEVRRAKSLDGWNRLLVHAAPSDWYAGHQYCNAQGKNRHTSAVF